MDWINNYIGLPWINGSQDCWWLVRQVYKDQLDIDLPQIVVDANNLKAVIKSMTQHPALSDWQPIEKPEHLCLTFFSNRSNPTHVGVYLDHNGGRILHTFKRAGCVLQSLTDIRLTGWTNPQYYRHKSQ
ncbi:NlpC/P60 family protein [Endozoicomonas sp. GU-1]|uniref:NlpC/P60 family protein n=1 Tax=Endozoicomonas sp. GU-1 TaxID=3009078 RepID=UPI0022B5D799|nr:NlpC/P60 family protein [Endozoicomonas sp. GU-1]WBA79542.1 NlpC/P60 family protein [Endozoicomonas sp. GU-1]